MSESTPPVQLSARLAFERYFWHIVGAIATFIFILLVVKFFFFDFGRVDGQSMEPTFIDDQVFLINRLTYLFAAPERYDIVQIVDPVNKKLIVKRVLGLPGEVITIKQGKVWKQQGARAAIEEVDERYLPAEVYTNIIAQSHPARYLVEDNHYFVLGDNRGNSTDSRVFGPVDRSVIVGKVLAIGSSRNKK